MGPAHLACRSASLIQWLHDTYYLPMGVSAAPLQCGFCLTGNSGGASQIAYSLAFYGLGDIVDAVVETGGPPHAALDKACLNDPGFGYSERLDSVLDISYGFYRPELGPVPEARPDLGGDVEARWRRHRGVELFLPEHPGAAVARAVRRDPGGAAPDGLSGQAPGRGGAPTSSRPRFRT